MPYPPIGLTGSPLENDDRALNNPTSLEFAGSPGGLDLPSSPPTPLGLQPQSGFGGLQVPSFNFAASGMQQLQGMAQQGTSQLMPTQQHNGLIYFSPSTGDIVVNGFHFNERNATQALVSEQWANQPRQRFTLPDNASDWQAMPREEYDAYLNTIKNPSVGRRLGEGWEQAWRGFGDTAIGAGMAIDRLATGTNDNEWLNTAHQNILREYEENAPFLLRLQDVDNVGDGLLYFAQMAEQGIPWLVETIASMAAGALVGGLVSGGVGAPAGAVEGFIAKEGLRQATEASLRTVLRNNIRRGATAYLEAQAELGTSSVMRMSSELSREQVLAFAARTGRASADDVNRFFNFGERAYHMARGGTAGQFVGMGASNYLTGVGDIRNSIEQAGGDPESAAAVANIWGMAVPYAMIESLGDIVLTQPITHAFPGVTNALARSAGMGDMLAARATNAAAHAGLTGVAEGAEEGAQYITTQQAVANTTNQPIDINPIDLLENVIGGFAAGTGMGAITGSLNRPGVRPPTVAPAAPNAAITGDPTVPPSGPLQGPDNAVPGGLRDDRVDAIEPMGGFDPNIDPAYGQSPQYTPSTMSADVNAEQNQMRDYARDNPGSTQVPVDRRIMSIVPAELTTPAEQRAWVYQQMSAPGTTEEQRVQLRNVLQILPTPEGPQYGPPPPTPFQALGNPAPVTTEQPLIDAGTGPASARQTSPRTSRVERINAGNERKPFQIWQAIQDGQDVTPNEVQELRQAVHEMVRQNPTDPQWTQILNELNSIERRRSLGMEAFPQPQLAPIDPNNVPLGKFQQPTTDGQTRARVGIPGSSGINVAPADDLRGRTEEEAPAPKKKSKSVKRREQRQRQNARNPDKEEQKRLKEERKLARSRPLPAPKTQEAADKQARKVASTPFGRRSQVLEDGPFREQQAAERAAAREEQRAAEAAYQAKLDTLKAEAERTLKNREIEANIDADIKALESARKMKLRRGTKHVRKGAAAVKAEQAAREQAAEAEPADRIKQAGERIKAAKETKAEPEQKKSTDPRVERTVKALKYLGRQKARPLFNVKQQVVNVMSSVYPQKEGAKPKVLDRDKYRWFFGVDGEQQLTREQLQEIIRILGEEINANKQESRAKDKAKITPNSQLATIIHPYVEEEWNKTKNPTTGSMETFRTFVLENKKSMTAWVNTPEVSGVMQKAQAAVTEILAERPTQQASMNEPANEKDKFQLHMPQTLAVLKTLKTPDLGQWVGSLATVVQDINIGDSIQYYRLVAAYLSLQKILERAYEVNEKKSTPALVKYIKDMLLLWEDMATILTYATKNKRDGDEFVMKSDGGLKGGPYGSPLTIAGKEDNNLSAEEDKLAYDLEMKMMLDELTDREWKIYNALREYAGYRPTSKEEMAYLDALLEMTDEEKHDNIINLDDFRKDIKHASKDDITNIDKKLDVLSKIADRDIRAQRKEGRAHGKQNSGNPNGRPKGSTIASAIIRRELLNNPHFTFKSIHPATRAAAEKVLNEIWEAQDAAPMARSRLDVLYNNTNQMRNTMLKNGELTRDANGKLHVGVIKIEQVTDRSVGPAEPFTSHLNVKEGRAAVAKMQRNILPSLRFSSTHVFKNIHDFIANAANEYLIHPRTGEKFSFDEYIKAEVSLIRMGDKQGMLRNVTDRALYKKFVMENLFSRAAVMPRYNAFLMFTDYIKDTAHMEQLLEHEYIGHKTIGVIFKTEQERKDFFNLTLKIPGMMEKIKQLTANRPWYRGLPDWKAAEEVLTHHMEHGPKVVEILLSSEEAIDVATGQTLWQKLITAFKDWVERVFGTKLSTIDQALDALALHLKEFALTGRTGNMQMTVYKYATGATEEQMKELVNEGDLDHIMQSAVTDEEISAQRTRELLFGAPDNPSMPYTPKSLTSDMYDTLKGAEPLLEKFQEVGKRIVATPISENLRKIMQELVTMNDLALESPLIKEMMTIMNNTIKTARNIMTRIQEGRQYDAKSARTAIFRRIWGDTYPGSTPEQLSAGNRIMIAATNHLMSQVDESSIRNEPRLVTRGFDGKYTVNADVFDDKGNDVSVYGQFLRRGILTREQLKAGIEQSVVTKKGDRSAITTISFTDAELDLGYEIYKAESIAMARSALETLKGRMEGLSGRGDRTIEDMMRGTSLTADDEAFMQDALKHIYKLYADIAFHQYDKKDRTSRFKQKEMAYEVAVELMRSFWVPAKVKDWTDSRVQRDENTAVRENDAFKWREQVAPHDDVKPFTSQIRWFLEYDDSFGGNRLQRLGNLGIGEQKQYAMMNAFQNLINNETLAQEKENDVIQSILGNYFEMVRKGGYRVALEIRNMNGEEMTDINPEILALLPTTYTETLREAQDLQAEWREKFSGTHKIKNAKGDGYHDITFDVSRARAPGMKTMGEAPKVREFLKVAELAGMRINPAQMKVIANLIETAAARKRLGLQRANTPGMDLDILRNNRETITKRAWEAAKASQAWMLESTMTDRRNLYGDWEHLAKLQEAFDMASRGAPIGQTPPAGFVSNPALVDITERRLLRYAWQLSHVARHTTGRPTVNVRTSKGEQKLKIKGQAEDYINHAQKLKASLEKDELDVNMEDFISKAGALRQFAVVAQLGTVASGIMNAYTPLTHLPWRLAAKHMKTGYGEGHSYPEIFSEIITAMTQVFPFWKNMTDSSQVKKMLDDAKAGNNTTGLALDELEDMYQETLDGLLMPQQTYSLTGGTESNIRDLAWRNFASGLLKFFSSIEAATRRVAWLVTRRLAKRRYMAAGITEAALNDPKSKEHAQLIEDIESVVNDSSGFYANINRPSTFRGPWMQYILQYKMFPLITVLLAKNLPLQERMWMLLVLGSLAGIKGEPFADDIADIYDTILQNLGVKHDSVELQITRALEDVLPGSSNWIMRGMVDNFAEGLGLAGGTTSSRLSMGDIIPLTGLFRPEADFGREIANAFGPAYAANVQALEWAATVADIGAQMVGMKPRTTDWVDIFRRMPLGQVRALFEAGQMGVTGQIRDSDGRVVSDDVTYMTMFTRALGFYPLEASLSNQASRLDRMHTGYMKSIRERFILAYAQAAVNGNQDDMQRIRDAVNDWNEATEMSGQRDMRITNFSTAANRAGRLAQRTAIERNQEGAATYSIIDEVAGILNADDEVGNDTQ